MRHLRCIEVNRTKPVANIVMGNIVDIKTTLLWHPEFGSVRMSDEWGPGARSLAEPKRASHIHILSWCAFCMPKIMRGFWVAEEGYGHGHGHCQPTRGRSIRPEVSGIHVLTLWRHRGIQGWSGTIPMKWSTSPWSQFVPALHHPQRMFLFVGWRST